MSIKHTLHRHPRKAVHLLYYHNLTRYLLSAPREKKPLDAGTCTYILGKSGNGNYLLKILTRVH